MTEDKKKAIALKLAVLGTYIIKMISDKRFSGQDTSQDEEIVPDLLAKLIGEIYNYDRKGFMMVQEATDILVEKAEKDMIKKGISLTDDNNSAQA
tara:strand:+ start:750 stop:1034 length:285 start_codon:yes stop_codon:yes gene_type:complete